MATAVTSNLSNIKRFEEVIATPKATTERMGQQDFLKLFTTQLQNQNPLDPTKNEAFVAQLAQFSQLEATTNMASQLTSFVNSSKAERMLSGAALIGKKVAIDDAPVAMTNGQPVQAVVQLPKGADGIRLEVFDKAGVLVRQQIVGKQPVGEVTVTWDGMDAVGSRVADGFYTIKATVTAAGQTALAPVKSLATVRSVSQADAASELMLQVDGGRSVSLSSVQRVGG